MQQVLRETAAVQQRSAIIIAIILHFIYYTSFTRAETVIFEFRYEFSRTNDVEFFSKSKTYTSHSCFYRYIFITSASWVEIGYYCREGRG